MLKLLTTRSIVLRASQYSATIMIASKAGQLNDWSVLKYDEYMCDEHICDEHKCDEHKWV